MFTTATDLPTSLEPLSGWGRTASGLSHVLRPTTPDRVIAAVAAGAQVHTGWPLARLERTGGGFTAGNIGNHDGERVANDDFEFTGSADDLAGYLRDMILARRFDAEATALQRHGELGLWTPLIGQEAAQVGSAHALRAEFALAGDMFQADRVERSSHQTGVSRVVAERDGEEVA